ncbi:hypothetical protein FRACYDRAFT_251801 [Fragilariopsis cylindrus CCMP1102]|uniref:HSF-type DNA-binding domain-containing protein n=1 Tax=Fragilariopsis cylindrus CCMP1102 TaxID=635003 RepID=A0A1E7EME5_9STRA|nr:hypothetical protein FRACYDRAFT_251801 [Fragilariopsis cylindrus CCMP1102]|eukprot:OEU07100.1 hypothetical protein FRACYDRAFT_251801 [Fragilariopsis cylindrus CCMP1102]
MSRTAYSGLSALIQAATSQLGDLGGGGETNAMEAGNVTMDTSVSGGNSSSSSSSSSRSIPTTPTLECEYYSRCGVSDLDLDGNNNNRYYAAAAAATAATVVTPLVTSISSYQHQHQHQGITSEGIDVRTTSSPPSTTFPMLLMNLLSNPAYEDIVTFLPDGKYFAIRRVDFTDLLLYNNFHLISFNDFLELIIRWGFIRVNNGNSINSKADHGNNDNNNNNSSNHKADIYVFRHPHFGMNQPVDMNKIKVRNVDMALLREELTNTSSSSYSKNQKSVETTNTNNNNNKRQLSKDFYHHQRSRSSSSSSTNDDKSTMMTPILLDPIYLASSSNENYRDQTAQQQQLRRRSSLELRSVAQAITASKLQLLHGCGGELVKESDIGSKNDYPDDNSSAPYHHCAADQQQERRQSTTSTNLVNGGVETATQNIVTDAIEALLFDESHTRDTFMRHEKELSVSSLPGVVPISMQLFSENNNDDGKSSDTSSSSSPSNYNDGGSKRNKSLGNCSRKNDHNSLLPRLRQK